MLASRSAISHESGALGSSAEPSMARQRTESRSLPCAKRERNPNTNPGELHGTGEDQRLGFGIGKGNADERRNEFGHESKGQRKRNPYTISWPANFYSNGMVVQFVVKSFINNWEDSFALLHNFYDFIFSTLKVNVLYRYVSSYSENTKHALDCFLNNFFLLLV